MGLNARNLLEKSLSAQYNPSGNAKQQPSSKQKAEDIHMRVFTAGNKTVSVFPAGEPGAPILYLNTFSEEGQDVYAAAQASGCPPFTLVAISSLDWFHDMVPWDSPPVFKNAAPCTGGADDYLQRLTQEIVPAAEEGLSEGPRWRGIAGYSLAGLFALYAIHQTALFSHVGCMSGSLWFPGFKDYLFSHKPIRWPAHIYFSLGDKEHKTRNPILQYVQQNTEEIQAFYQQRGIDTIFQLQPGNHNHNPAARTAAGIGWLLRR